MKKSEIIKLRLKGVSTDEIKELMQLETMAEDSEETEELIKEEEHKEEATAKHENQEEAPEESKENITDETIATLQKEIDDLRSQLADAQKANRSMDISGSIPPDHSDQDMITEMVRSFM